MIPPTQRLNYFNHQLLRVQDFADEQAYHLGMRRAHNRMLHTPGVAQGLEVDPAGSTLAVHPGVALDGTGREIVLQDGAEVQVPAELAGKTAWLTIAYGERTADPTAEAGAAGDRRREELAVLNLAETAPSHPDTQLVLGRVTIDGARSVVRVDDGEGAARRHVSGPAPGAELSVRTLSVAGGRPFATTDGDLTVGTAAGRLKVGAEVEGAAAGTARLRAEGAAPRLVLGAGGADVVTVTAAGVSVASGAPLSVAGAATVGGALTAGGSSGLTVTAAGKVGVGVSSPDALLDVNDRIRLRGVNGNGTTAGVWLRHGTVDRGFVGMKTDDVIGLFGTVWGLTMSATGNVGIRQDPSSTAALAVAGSFTATTKNFRIPHPLKAGLDLVHASLEGPEHGVYYRGTARLRDGRATVRLPDYFEALTRPGDRTVQLTARGREPFALSHGGVADGAFEVFGARADGEFDWEVRAARADVPALDTEVAADAGADPAPAPAGLSGDRP
jgi:hypothetical protein